MPNNVDWLAKVPLQACTSSQSATHNATTGAFAGLNTRYVPALAPALAEIPVSTVATAGQRPVDWRKRRGSSRAGAQALVASRASLHDAASR